ncbi:hypothetical protein ABTZ78_13320 [Streptomyces bauhiniae]|uniref:hypothetical protein n=1 Tax=Streptomyces bauhiniae TaxID=2340725 RepID=UPI003330989F
MDCDEAVDQLAYFDGMVRRMTAAGEAAGAKVYDSFAHHPEEVEADLTAARSLVGGVSRGVVPGRVTWSC